MEGAPGFCGLKDLYLFKRLVLLTNSDSGWNTVSKQEDKKSQKKQQGIQACPGKDAHPPPPRLLLLLKANNLGASCVLAADRSRGRPGGPCRSQRTAPFQRRSANVRVGEGAIGGREKRQASILSNLTPFFKSWEARQPLEAAQANASLVHWAPRRRKEQQNNTCKAVSLKPRGPHT